MVFRQVKEFLRMVDFGHSLFGLPFAYLGAFLALRAVPSAYEIFWITVAMVSARTAALCLNRLIDREIDRANPRTSNWAMAAGVFRPGIIWLLVGFFLMLLMYSAWKLNPLCLKLAPLAVIILWFYSYTKRFTWWCHLVLGLAISMGPVGGWIAVTGSWSWEILLLAVAVATWVAGFDIMYACQDIQFDRRHKLFSIPARFGERGALGISSLLHFLTVVFLLLNGMVFHLGTWYYLGVLLAALILTYEHIIIRPGHLLNINFISFHINRYVSLIIFVAVLLDLFY